MKDKIKSIHDKLVSHNFNTDDYDDLDLISEVIQDLKEVYEKMVKNND